MATSYEAAEVCLGRRNVGHRRLSKLEASIRDMTPMLILSEANGQFALAIDVRWAFTFKLTNAIKLAPIDPRIHEPRRSTMRYFTREMWGGLQGSSANDAMRQWQRNLVAYRKQLAPLLDRMSKRSARFFEKHSLHDGTLLSLCVGDCILRSNLEEHRQKRATKIVLTASPHVSKPFPVRIYQLVYRGVTDIQVRSDDSLFPASGTIFGDWGYDELLAEGAKNFRHNILFQTGTEISIVFEQLAFKTLKSKG